MEITGILFLTMFVESFVEYVFGNVEKAKKYLMYIALGFGVLASIFYKIDIPSMIGLTSSVPYVNYVVSGLILGRGSNYVNDVVSWFRSRK